MSDPAPTPPSAMEQVNEYERQLIEHHTHHESVWCADYGCGDIRFLVAQLRERERESETRRQTLIEVRAQQVADWRRAEVAEAEVERLREALEKADRYFGEVPAVTTKPLGTPT